MGFPRGCGWRFASTFERLKYNNIIYNEWCQLPLYDHYSIDINSLLNHHFYCMVSWKSDVELSEIQDSLWICPISDLHRPSWITAGPTVWTMLSFHIGILGQKLCVFFQQKRWPLKELQQLKQFLWVGVHRLTSYFSGIRLSGRNTSKPGGGERRNIWDCQQEKTVQKWGTCMTCVPYVNKYLYYMTICTDLAISAICYLN